MNKLNLKGEDLKTIGYPEGKAIGIAIQLIFNYIVNINKKIECATLVKIKYRLVK